jgi:hypothetical protein
MQKLFHFCYYYLSTTRQNYHEPKHENIDSNVFPFITNEVI